MFKNPIINMNPSFTPQFFPSPNGNNNNNDPEGSFEISVPVLFMEQQRKIKYLEDELSLYKAKVTELSLKLNTQDRVVKEVPKKKPQSRYWTPEEHQAFLDGLESFGPKDVKSIAATVKTRNATQVRTHAQKYFLRLLREQEREVEREKERESGHFESTLPPSPDSPLISSEVSHPPDPNYFAEYKDGLDPPSRRQKISEIREMLMNRNSGLTLNDFSKAEQDLCVEGLKTFQGDSIDNKTELIQRKLLPKRDLEEVLQLVDMLYDRSGGNDKSRKRTRKSQDITYSQKRQYVETENKKQPQQQEYHTINTGYPVQNLANYSPGYYPTIKQEQSPIIQQSPIMQSPVMQSPVMQSPVMQSPLIHPSAVHSPAHQQIIYEQQCMEDPTKLAFSVPDAVPVNVQFPYGFAPSSLSSYVGQQQKQQRDPPTIPQSRLLSQAESPDNSQWNNTPSPQQTTVDGNILVSVSPKATEDF